MSFESSSSVVESSSSSSDGSTTMGGKGIIGSAGNAGVRNSNSFSVFETVRRGLAF